MTERERDLSYDFAAMAAETTIDALPDPAIEAAKMSILDTVGVSVAASGTEPAVQAMLDLVADDGGPGEAVIWGLGQRVPAANAAFANGALAHCLDFDDQTPWGQHASSSVVPAAIAVAERKGGVSGPSLIAAVAAGQDIFARLRCHVGWRKDWNLSSAIGIYAGTAAASRILGMPGRAVQHALGIASQQSAGLAEVLAGTGSDLRAVYAGFSARGAVTATLLAERGLTGVDQLFEGPYGVFNTYFGGHYDREPMLAGLGHEYRGAGTLYKLWPSVGTSHSHIHAMIELMSENALAGEDLREIRVYVGDYHQLMCTPLATRQAPQTLVDAKFSLPFLLALAAVHRSVKVEHFTAAGLDDDRVRAVAAKILPVADASLDWKLELPPGRVEVITNDGRRFSKIGSGYPGSVTRPTPWSDLAQKFRDCAALAARKPSADQVETIIAMCRDLETIDDVSEITGALG
ncbi:2-methylcitrate dehydratase PrpD [Kribbella sp. VKM Ac-2527]|uniref:2-methylcitrate dehydratase PrpD n=1 Tax=Kribbella caucasensis TaxID=2512215 RepID=A0A4R6KK29_9ACTN|nr:MmgE/PrpD family protein [Kribbella sp. VKM Ac-2527]TDO51678.1 2-methylcitrate dehydratase PrpD [Kribbella sp. VKM Ac-2527]